MDWKPKGLIFLGSKGIPTPNHAAQLFISKHYTWKKKLTLIYFHGFHNLNKHEVQF